MAALDQAGTVVCEPMIRVSLEIPAGTTGSVLATVARLGGTAGTPVLRASLDPLTTVRTLLPAARAQDLQRQLPGLTSGEGVAETSFGGYRPVAAAPAEQAQSSGGR
jgi:ribosomal protection tetracycline resistance protein